MFDSNTHLLLTGGTGFFGLSLLRHWCALGTDAPRITVLSRNPERFTALYPELASFVHWSRGDVLVPTSLPHGTRFSHILHAATDSTLGPTLSSLLRYAQIVDGTRNILDFAVASGASRFLLTSSGGVYGPQPHDMEYIPESYNGMPDPLNSQNTYSVAKRCAEHMCAIYQNQHGLETVVARCFAFAGRDLPLDAHFAIGNFIQDALTRKEIVVKGDGNQVRSYMDQRDLANWLTMLLLHGQPGQAYNVGSDVAITITELAKTVCDILSPYKSVRITGIATAPNFRNRYVPCTIKARSELGLNLRYGLDDSIRDIAAHNSC